MSPACAAGGAGDIAGLLNSVDCFTALYVERAYARLFGEAGALMPALIGALTIYVALYGYRLMLGGSVRLPDLARRFALIGVLFAFVGNWPAYQTVFVNTVSGGAEDVAALLQSAASGTAPRSGLSESLGETLDAMTTLAADGAPARADAPLTPVDIAPPRAPAGVSAATMIWLSAAIVGVSSAGVLIVIKASLGFLLALGPAFLFLALFRQTRGLTEGWLRTIAGGMFALIFTTLATSMALLVIDPMVAAAADARAAGRSASQSAFTLMIACIVFAMLVRQSLAVTARLAGAWRLPGASEDERPAPPAAESVARLSLPPASRVDAIAAAAGFGAASAPSIRASAAAGALAPTIVAARDADGRATMRRAARAYRGFGAQTVSARSAP